MPAYQLDRTSAMRLLNAHPSLRHLILSVVADGVALRVLDSQRGRVAQDEAFRRGNSKARFGQSPHNWSPSIALDVVPVPLNWNDLPSFKRLGAKIKAKARELGIPIRWGGDWSSFKDYPHYELHPWRTWAKASKPFEG